MAWVWSAIASVLWRRRGACRDRVKAVVAAAEYDMPLDKRSAIFQALDHLVQRLKPQATGRFAGVGAVW